MLRFIRSWGHSLVWGDSLWSVAAKAIALVLALGLAKWADYPVGVWFLMPDRGVAIWKDWSAGWMAVYSMAAIYVLWRGGVAWARTRGPRLWVDTSLIEDVDYQMFRIMVGNRGSGVMEPQAWMRWVRTGDIVNGEGTPFQPGVGPFPLEWLHLENMRRPKLSYGDEITLAIAYLPPPSDRLREVAVAGDFRHRPTVGRDLNIRFLFRVTAAETGQFVDRQFALFPDKEAPLHFTWTYEGPFPIWERFVRMSRKRLARVVVMWRGRSSSRAAPRLPNVVESCPPNGKT